MNVPAKRFRVAFSFAGAKRAFVEQVASILAARFGAERILYDKYHEAEFARRDLGIYLPDLYRNQSDLIVAVFSADYDSKQWTGLEWTGIHDLLSHQNNGAVLLCRFDHSEVKGLFSTAGFVELDQKSPQELAGLILQRLAVNEGHPRDFFLAPAAAVPTKAPDPHPFTAVTKSDPRDLVYISYRHRDKHWHRLLRRILSADPDLKNRVWDDTDILPGDFFARAIDHHVARARIMLMLTSEDYFGPESGALECEIKPALEAHAGNLLTILWVPVRSHDYAKTPVGQILAATGAGAIALEELGPDEQMRALHQVHDAVRRCLALPPKQRAPFEPLAKESASQQTAHSPAKGLPAQVNEGPRRLVILIHGIRTRAEWQGRMRSLLEKYDGTIVETLGYGYFHVLAFLCPLFTRDAPVREITEKVRGALHLHQGKYDEVVIVAHSFASYIVGEMLRENPTIAISRVLLCGSVLRRDYAWDRLPNRPKRVLNEVGSKDIWPILAHSVTWGFGSSGTFGFQTFGVRDRFHPIKHSDYFKPGFAEKYWIPWVLEGTDVSSEHESSERPTTPFLKNLIDVIHLKWIAILSLIVMAILALVEPKHQDLHWGLIDPASPSAALERVRSIVTDPSTPFEDQPLLKGNLERLRGTYRPQQQYVSFLSTEFDRHDLSRMRLEIAPSERADLVLAGVLLRVMGDQLMPVAPIQLGLDFPVHVLSSVDGRLRLLVLLFPISRRGDSILRQPNAAERVIIRTNYQPAK